jgi:hypothetical protein
VPRIALFALPLALVALSGCSLKQSNTGSAGAPPGSPPGTGAKSSDKNAAGQLGFPITATRNTTRVAGADPVADAAGVASALFPAGDASSRPPAVSIVDKSDWQGAIAAAALVGPPVRAPILLSDGDNLPAVSSTTLSRLKPKGTSAPNGAQVILVGDKPSPPSNMKSTVIHSGGDAYSEAAAVDRLAAVAKGKPSGNVIVTSGEKPEYAMPAAAWAARSGDAVLFVKKDSVPSPTRKALVDHQRPHIWVLGPPSVISTKVVRQLGALGPTTRIDGPDPVSNAIAFARFKGGWNARIPGQNLTIASSSRPGDAAAAAGLGANGIYAPLLLTDDSSHLPRSLDGYLLDVEPGFQNSNPSQGVYNHIWILGPTDAISQQEQARIDTDAALIPVTASG